jgi:hypothetical protein
MVDHDGFAALPDLVADGGLDLEFPAGRKPERDLATHRAANPPILGDARDGGETHAGGTAHHFENARHRCDPLYGSDIRTELGRHCPAFNDSPRANASARPKLCREILRPEPKPRAALSG